MTLVNGAILVLQVSKSRLQCLERIHELIKIWTFKGGEVTASKQRDTAFQQVACYYTSLFLLKDCRSSIELRANIVY